MFHKGKLKQYKRHFLLILCWCVSAVSNVSAQSDAFLVVIDPGHGGKDPGNVHNGYYESKITLAIAKQVKEYLKDQRDIKVVLTRETDVAIDLYARGPIANKLGADVFVSIHCDAHDSAAHGAGTFVLGLHRADTNLEVAKRENAVIYREQNFEQNYAKFNSDAIGASVIQEENLNQSINLAYKVQQGLVNKAGRRDRLVKQAGFVVLYGTVMPSVLIETGFLSNPNEGAFLNSKSGQQKVASAIAEALIEYKNEFFLNSVVASDVSLEGPYYQIQLAASDKELASNDSFFNGLNPIFREEGSTLIRYFYGRTSSYQSAQQFLAKAREKGFKDAFIVTSNK